MQRLKHAIKKVAAISTGAVMLGATMTGAVALDLGDYPSPFVKNGVYDPSNAIVVGASAAASDTLGAVDIATNLQFESKVCVPGPSAGSVQVSGDAVEIGDPSDLLELRETLGNVRETLTEVELDGLRGGTITTNEGSTEWNQYIRFSLATDSTGNSLRSPSVNFTENDDVNEEVGDFLFINEGTNITSDAFFEYELEFEEGLESEVSSTELTDLEDEEIIILGQTYNVVDSKIDTILNEITIEMLGGAIFDTLEEGEVKTYTLDGKDYKVEVVIIEDTQPETVTMNINGEVTDQLLDGETEVLEDGTLIGISDIVSNEAGEAGSGDIVEFYIGASKVVLKDLEYTGTGFEQGVKIDNEQIEDAYLSIRVNELEGGTVAEIQSIKYRLLADALPGQNDIFVPPGHGVREYLDEPEGLLGRDWDIFYAGLDDTGVSVIKLDPSGDDQYNLEFENRQGQLYNIPLISNEGAIFKYGDEDNELVFVEGAYNETGAHPIGYGHGIIDIQNTAANYSFNIGDDDWFILSNSRSDANDETAFTHIVRYTSIDTSNNLLTFDDEAVGTRTFTYSGLTNTSFMQSIGSSDLVFGGTTFRAYVENITNTSSTTHGLAIDMNADGNINLTEVRVTVNGGGIIDLGNATESNGHVSNGSAESQLFVGDGAGDGTLAINVTLTTLSSEFDEDGPETGGTNNEVIQINITSRSNNEVGIGANSVGGVSGTTTLTLHEPDEDRDHAYGMSDFGVFVDLFDEAGTDEAETLTIEYPLVQRGAKVFVTMGPTTTSSSKAGQICTVADITPASMLDTEVGSRASSYNLILVGDSCVNKLVADLWGVSYPSCGEDLPYGPGESIVQLVENGNKVAMIVAGYDAIDTRTAAKVVANYGDYDLSGDKVTVTGTISSPQVKLG
ncbi:MAG: S-layer protein [Candidatus Nanoarchaeia archaeon]|nr:S-layer protein [Candidatus Nanoarchaeia archaeon]